MIRRLLRVMVVGLVTVAVGVGTATHAYAVPSPEEIEAQIDAQWRVLEPIIEEYNGINDKAYSRRRVSASYFDNYLALPQG